MTPTEIGLIAATVTAVTVLLLLIIVVFGGFDFLFSVYGRRQSAIRSVQQETPNAILYTADSIQEQAAAQGVSVSHRQAVDIARAVTPNANLGTAAQGVSVSLREAPVIVQAVENPNPILPNVAPPVKNSWTAFFNSIPQPMTRQMNTSRECGGCLTGRRKHSRKGSRKSSRIA